VPARDFGHDLDAMAAAITPATRVVFVANPNNPTGTWIAPERMRRFVEAVPRDVVVVLDEAYNEYLAPRDDAQSARWLRDLPNLVVSRTFSKAYGLAGLRVGYGVMRPEVADLLNRVRPPFNVNALAQAAAIEALADTAYVDESRRLNDEGMRALAGGFEALKLRYLPSRGNFVLVDVGDGMRVFERLLRAGVIVRPVANYGLPAWIRVTVGLPDENARLLAALPAALAR
jgi:histidinol-phosphate aminotransferase